MTLYKRNWNCAVCGKPVIWDSEAKTLTCKCKVQPNVTFVSMEAFTPIPKIDIHAWKETLTVPIDSAKFLSNELLLDGSQVIFISDRQSIFRGNEEPEAQFRWIHYPEKDKVQLCIAVSGAFHTEKISYSTINPTSWKERLWIYISSETIKHITAFLEKNPQLLASWM